MNKELRIGETERTQSIKTKKEKYKYRIKELSY